MAGQNVALRVRLKYGQILHRTTYSCVLITPQFAKRTQLSRTRRGASTERHSSEEPDLWGHCCRRRLLAAEAARPDDRSSSSGAPGDLGHLQPG